MLVKTHLAITSFFVLLLISLVENKFLFILISFFATMIPDIDSRFSKLGRKKGFRILQFFIKHRGILHSFTFLILITILFVLILPKIALPLFLGYGLHLIADSFTIQGIFPFYPLNKKVSGKIRSGGRVEIAVFLLFVFFNLLILFSKIL